MSRFYASIQGNRGAATRQGTSQSGVFGHLRGWHVGVRVNMVDDEEGRDVGYIYLTSGSNDDRSLQYIGKVIIKGSLPQFIPGQEEDSK